MGKNTRPAKAQNRKPGTSGLAVTSLILSLSGIAPLFMGPFARVSEERVLACYLASFLLALVGVAFGLAAVMRIGKNKRTLGGQKIAIAGLLAAFGVMLFTFAIAGLHGASTAQVDGVDPIRDKCVGNLKQLGVALSMYSADWDGRYPSARAAARWNDALGPYLKSRDVLTCPAVKGTAPTYAMNRRIVGMREKDVAGPASVVAMFESIPGKNLVGGEGQIPSPRHDAGNSILFADGHVTSELFANELDFDPEAEPATRGARRP